MSLTLGLVAGLADFLGGFLLVRRSPSAKALRYFVALGAGFMLCMAVLLVSMPRTIARWFTHGDEVVAAAVPLLMVGAAFQFFDGVQVTATGALRGVGITKPGLAAQVLGYWVVGLPVGLWLGFARKWGAVGLWVGLASGLMAAALGLAVVWVRALRRGIGARAV